MTSDPAVPAANGIGSGPVATAGAVPEDRSGTARPRDLAAASIVLERAKGAVMALTGCSAEAAHEELLSRARTGGRTLIEECRITAGGDSSARTARDAEGPGPRPEIRVETDGPGEPDASTDLGRLTDALRGLNTLLPHSRGPHGTAAMAPAHYHPDGRRLVWAQAGHPRRCCCAPVRYDVWAVPAGCCSGRAPRRSSSRPRPDSSPATGCCSTPTV